MLKQFRWPREALVPILAGFVWLWHAYSFGILGFMFAVVPGCLLLSAGVSALLYPGDYRISQFIALGGLLGTVLGIIGLVGISVLTGLMLIGLSVAAYVCAGFISIRQNFQPEDVPAPERSVRLAAEVALDESLLALQTAIRPLFIQIDPAIVSREVEDAVALYTDRGWLDNPADYHQAPPPLETVVVESCQSGEFQFEHLCFDSGYAPCAEEPGRDRWLSYQPNRTAHAWALCHHDLSRPWVIGIHGYGMGVPRTFFRVFQAMRFHRELGLNLVFPVLPYHGPRKVGRWHGEGFGSGDVMDFIHAEAQAMWDIRRLLTWIRAQGATAIGLGGLSLGGYNAALLASLESGFACVIAGVPTADFLRQARRHASPLALRYASQQGLAFKTVQEAMKVISPLALTPLIPRERRYIFGAANDRLVSPSQVRDLWLHWDKPPILWYQGAHLTYNWHPEVVTFVGDAMRKSGLVRR